MTCPKEAELGLYAGGEAALRKARRVENHVRTCARCARKVAEFQLVRSAVVTSGSRMPPSAREQVRAEILVLISRESSSVAGIHPLLAIVPIACVLIALIASASLGRMLQLPHESELKLALPLDSLDPPALAFVFSARRAPEPATSPEPVRPRPKSRGNLELAQLQIAATADGLATLALLRIPANDPSLEIHWIME